MDRLAANREEILRLAAQHGASIVRVFGSVVRGEATSESDEAYTQDGRAAFFASPMQQDAVVRNFEIVGEAAKRISDELKQRYPDIPWRRIAGFRDVLRHQDMGVDLNDVWRIVEQDVPTLRTQIAALLAFTNEGSQETNG